MAEATALDASWPALPPGTALQVVKRSPDGREAARYPGTIIATPAPSSWLALRATWVARPYNLNGLLFLAGDTLHEYFSPSEAFNVFAVFAPDGTLRGWYANVTYPAKLDTTTDPPTLTWHDLYLDLVALPDGTAIVRDEDELAASGLASADPALHAMILAARDELLARWRERAFPFHERHLDRGTAPDRTD